MSFKNRVEKARAGARFAKVVQKDKAGKVRAIVVPGSDGKQYQVILRRHGGIWSGECRLDAGPAGYVPCPGNKNGFACYHCMAAVIVAAEDARKKVQFANSEPKAKKLENLGMKAFRLQPWNNGKLASEHGETVWVLVK